MDVLNAAMNEASSLIHLEIAKEQDITHLDSDAIEEMSTSAFTDYCERQDMLLDTRINDIIQILMIVLTQYQKQQKCLETSHKQTTHLINEYNQVIKKLKDSQYMVRSYTSDNSLIHNGMYESKGNNSSVHSSSSSLIQW